MQKEIKFKGEDMANPYGNNGFGRIQGQPQPQQMNRQQGYADPRFGNQQPMYGGQPQMQQGYVDPRFGNQQPASYMDPRFGNQQPTGYMDPRFAGQQGMYGTQPQMTPQQMQQMQMQQMQMQQMQRQMPGSGINPMQAAAQPQFGQPMQQQFGQPQQQTVGKAFSSIVEDVKPTTNAFQQQTQQEPVKQQEPEVGEEMFGPADGFEFPPYYNKNTERLVKVYNRDTMTYTWKIEKLQK